MSVVSFNTLIDFLNSATFVPRYTRRNIGADGATLAVGGVAGSNFAIVGGQDKNSNQWNRVLLYNIAQQTTQSRTSSTANIVGAVGAGYKDRYIIFAAGTNFGAGEGTRRTYQYDIVNDTFTALASAPDRRLNVGGDISEDALYMIGGYSWDQDGDYPCFYRLNIAANTWSSIASTGFPARRVVVVGDKTSKTERIFVCYRDASFALFAVYDRDNRMWTTLPNPPTQITGGKGEVIEGKVYFFTGPWEYTLVYNIASKTWSTDRFIGTNDFSRAITGVYQDTTIVAYGNTKISQELSIYERYSSNVSTNKLNEVQSHLALLNRRELGV